MTVQRLPQRSWKKSNANAAGAKTCRIFSAYFQLIVVYCIYKLKKAEGNLPVNILIAEDEPRLADVVYTGTDGLDYAQNGSGTGLGLVIAQSICQAHHAAIRAESGQDGTTFRVEIKKEQGEHHGN